MDGRVFCRRAHGELVHVGLADDQTVFGLDEAGGGGVKNGAIVGENFRGAGGELSQDMDVIFEGDGDAGEFAEGFSLFSLFVEVDCFF